MSIKLKILIPMIILTVVASAAILVSNIVLFSGNTDKTMQDRVNTASAVAQSEFGVRQSLADTSALALSTDPQILEAVINGERASLTTKLADFQKDNGIGFCAITGADGRVIGLSSTKEISIKATDLSAMQSVASALAGNDMTTIESGVPTKMSICSARPVYGADGAVIGAAVTGFSLDTNEFVDSVKELMGCEVTVFHGDERISTTVVKDDGSRATGTTAAENVSKTVLAGNIYQGTAQILNQDALTKYAPLSDSSGKVIGMLFVGRFLTEKTTTVNSFVMSGLIILVILLLVAIPVILILVGKIVSPISAMVRAARALASGDTDVAIKTKTNDEMRKLSDALNEMIENTRQQTQIIGAIAHGDLSVSVYARSDKDIMNHELESMLKLNNNVFADIVQSTVYVSAGARQIAESSQVLAQGATQQAAAVDELSSIISDVSLKTAENAELAGKASALSSAIMQNARRGNEQMNRMVQAVMEINEASKSINKIIKVIDDIAFQTNILALNAAVEAARAGQHGKGFAVVAEEVRNLAAKSADAAKNTGSLIENSIIKAELGVGIAGETASSLDEIVNGIDESARIIGEIAGASEQQSASLSLINVGINQVSEVVQQNNATAQQSAASSEEMSSQAMMLEKLVSQFKLRSGEGQRALPGIVGN